MNNHYVVATQWVARIRKGAPPGRPCKNRDDSYHESSFSYPSETRVSFAFSLNIFTSPGEK